MGQTKQKNRQTILQGKLENLLGTHWMYFAPLFTYFFDGNGVSMRLTRVFECFGLFCFVALRCRLCGCSDQICYSHCSHSGYLRSHRVCHVNPLSTHSFPSFYLPPLQTFLLLFFPFHQ